MAFIAMIAVRLFAFFRSTLRTGWKNAPLPRECLEADRREEEKKSSYGEGCR